MRETPASMAASLGPDSDSSSLYEALFEGLASRQVETDAQFLSLLPSVASGEAQKLVDEAKAAAKRGPLIPSIIENLDALFKVPPVGDLKGDWEASGKQGIDDHEPELPQPAISSLAQHEDVDGMSPVVLAQEKITCILDAPQETKVQVDNLFDALQDDDQPASTSCASVQAAPPQALAVQGRMFPGEHQQLWPEPADFGPIQQHITLPGGCIQSDADLAQQEQLDQVFEAAGGVLHHLGLDQAPSQHCEEVEVGESPHPVSAADADLPSGQEEDAVQAFQLDPTFDYDNAPLTRRDWPPIRTRT